MKRVSWIFSVFILTSSVAVTQIPQTMSYQGRLTDTVGSPVANGNYSLTFRLYDVSSGGAALWTETQASVPVNGGIFSAMLGSVTPFGIPFDKPYWLGVSVQGGAELTPRTALSTSPYSIRSLGVLGSNNIFPPSGNVGIGTTNPTNPLQVETPGQYVFTGRTTATNGPATINLVPGSSSGDMVLNVNSANRAISLQVANTEMMRVGGNGNVGIGTTNPSEKLEIGSFSTSSNAYIAVKTGGGNLYKSGIKLKNFADDDGFTLESDETINKFNIIRHATSSTVAFTIDRLNGNVGIGTTSPGYPLHVVTPTGGYIASRFENAYVGANDGTGVFGRSLNAEGYGYGGRFEGGWYGVTGTANAGAWGSSAIGVYGYAVGTAGTRYGVYGEAAGAGGTKYGVYGTASGGTANYAGYFAGNVTVTGSVTKASGTFKIDHPLDPANKYLLHSFVESPDMMNVYNGNVTLDANGEATIELPNWFEALNKDFRYQLTAVGRPGPNLYVAEKVQYNRFKIAGGVAGMEVSWQLTGVRKDAWANANRIQVEVDKPAEERGKYLHPEAIGLTKDSAIPALQPKAASKQVE